MKVNLSDVQRQLIDLIDTDQVLELQRALENGVHLEFQTDWGLTSALHATNRGRLNA